MLNGCCFSHPAWKSCPVALAGEQLWALSQAWPWLEMEHLLPESPGVCLPSITWQNLPTRLQEMQVENCSPELSPGLTGSGKASMDSSAELLPSFAGMFTGTSSYQPKFAFMIVGQKERRTEGERQLYLQIKDKFKNCDS